MNRPTKFQIMRCNRPKLVKARETLIERIDRIEREVTSDWDLPTVQLVEQARREQRGAIQLQPPRERAPVGWWPFRRLAQ